MRFILLLASIAMAASTGAYAAGSGEENDGHTTVVQDANGTTVITQSGDPAQAEVKVEREPGRTTVYRHSGGNTTIVTQSSGPGAIPPNAPDWLRNLFGR